MKIENTPFSDPELYPIVGFLTSSFLDPYIQKYYSSINHILPNGIDITPAWTEYISLLSTLAGKLKDFFGYLNSNNLEKLRESYNIFNEEYDKEVQRKYQESSESISIDTIKEINKSFGDFNSQIKKQSFLNNFADTINLIVTKEINKYNKTHADTSIFIDNTDIICMNKQKGVFVLNSSNLTKLEIDSIVANNKEIFNYQKKLFGVNTDSFFIVYMHLLFIIKNRPFGLMFLNPRWDDNPYARYYLDYFNSDEAIEMRANGGIWWDGEHDDDDYEDF